MEVSNPVLATALKRCNGNKSLLGAIAGMSRQAIDKALKRGHVSPLAAQAIGESFNFSTDEIKRMTVGDRVCESCRHWTRRRPHGATGDCVKRTSVISWTQDKFTCNSWEGRDADD